MDDKKITKAEQFLIDVGLHVSATKLMGAPKIAEKPPIKMLGFLSSVSMKMDNPDAALAVHIQNLILTYGEDKVKGAINKEVTIKALEKDTKLWLF